LGGVLGSLLKTCVSHNLIYFPFASEILSILPFSFGWKLRRAIYARVLPQVGTDVLLNFGVILEDNRTTFGNDVWVSTGSYIDYAVIGSHVLIGQHVVILAGGRHHNFDRLDVPIKHQGNPAREPVKICEGAWIGAHATIMADVGAHAIVGAGSVVVKPVPDYTIVAGNPAAVIRDRRQSNLTGQVVNFKAAADIQTTP
jgi:acetyltransferase-like isoleucine patch superfamily enzyme